MSYLLINGDIDAESSDNEGTYLFSSKKLFTTHIHGASKDEIFKANGYKLTTYLQILYHLFGILSIGTIYLICYWKPEWRLFFKCKKSKMEWADYLILKDVDGLDHVVEVKICETNDDIPENYMLHDHYGGRMGRRNYESLNTNRFKYFELQYLKYIWNAEKGEFQCLLGVGDSITIKELVTKHRGFSLSEQRSRQRLFGQNEIAIVVPSYMQLLFTEVLNPFYIFQVASIALWACDEYYQYAFCVFFISCLSILLALRETKQQSVSLRDMVEASNSKAVNLLRHTSNNERMDVMADASSVVPGDVLIIPASGCVMACDAVLISGNAIVNESMLTGESVPVTKTAVTSSEEDEIYSLEGHKRHTLFCGTSIIQTRYYDKAQVLAVVVRTGFATAKGELVRSILHPRPVDFKFYKDAMKFILLLFVIATGGMAYSLYLYISRHEPLMRTIIRTLDIVTIVVPPALPAAMTVGTFYAQSRLKKGGIFCISPPRINLCGKIKLMCFDKTGTLTEDGLDVWGAMQVERSSNQDQQLSQPITDLTEIGVKNNLMKSLVTCHSLTYVDDSLIGDPLDLRMFEATGWTLTEPEQRDGFNSMQPTVVSPPRWAVRNASRPQTPYCLETDLDMSLPRPPGAPRTPVLPEDAGGSALFDPATPLMVTPGSSAHTSSPEDIIDESSFQVPYEIGILRQFPFSSSLQRMGVIVRALGTPHMEFMAKGAPEKIITLCCPDSVPADFSSVLNRFTEQGFRVIAFAHKELPPRFSWLGAQKVRRDQLENHMTFTGFLVLQNVLKTETTPVIKELTDANIRTVMVTGDNILTGISVARDCHMVQPDENVYLLRVVTDGTTKSLKLERTNSPEPLPDRDCVVDIKQNNRLAVTGSDWALVREYFPDFVPYVVAQGVVFGRMSPEQKVQLVEELQALDYIVGMCGDGANDCGALKAAHVGVSLSEAEASVAAPFTSHLPDIRCIPKLICEGRCALTTNFSVFKYMALYSIIQFVSVLVLYTACTILSDPQFLYIDLFIVTLVAIFMGYTKPTTSLVKQRPLSNLFGAVNLFSVISQIILVCLIQIGAFLYLTMQPWYDATAMCPGHGAPTTPKTWETNVIFCVSSLQYLALAVIFSPGQPYRKPLYTNWWLVSTIALFSGFSITMTLYPGEMMSHLLQLKPFVNDPQWLFRGTLIMIAALNYVIGAMLEHYVANSRTLKKIFQTICCKEQPKNRYKRILREIDARGLWGATSPHS